jgi:signal transduction histidine kinase
MLRSLAFKLSLAFLLVGLTGAILVAVIVRYRTQREFTDLVLSQNLEYLVAELTDFYAETGSWVGVEQILRTNSGPGFGNRLPEQGREPRQFLFVIADDDGVVVAGGGQRFLGRELDRSVLRRGTALSVNGDTVGWLLFAPELDRWEPGTPEGIFLSNVNQAIWISALVATGIALALGGLLAFGLTRSLREMTAATRDLAQGKLGRQVKVRSQDEVGELAKAFNQMSRDLANSTELRRQMTANIAHDLRSPLSVIMGYTEALSDGKLQPDQEMFSVVHTEAQHLSRLIEDLKLLSLADARELRLVHQTILPERLLQRSADAYHVQADKRGITIRVQAEEALPEIRVDIERMMQVLGNLMSNALRYTPSGGVITLAAARHDGGVELQVADTGVGIDADDLPYIFERSYRGDKARTQEQGESGLGLAVAKSLVEAQGGVIKVDSRPGEGSVFKIQLPISKPHA